MADILGVTPVVWPDLHEVRGLHFLEETFKGKSREEFEEAYPGVILDPAITSEGWYFKGRIEQDDEAHARALSIWAKLTEISKQPDAGTKTVAVITHGMFLDFLIGALSGRPIRGIPRYAFFNTGYSLIELQEPHPVFFYVNRKDHLSVMPLLFHMGHLD
jgi:broad specificity phosphatase PhoE